MNQPLSNCCKSIIDEVTKAWDTCSKCGKPFVAQEELVSDCHKETILVEYDENICESCNRVCNPIDNKPIKDCKPDWEEEERELFHAWYMKNPAKDALSLAIKLASADNYLIERIAQAREEAFQHGKEQNKVYFKERETIRNTAFELGFKQGRQEAYKEVREMVAGENIHYLHTASCTAECKQIKSDLSDSLTNIETI